MPVANTAVTGMNAASKNLEVLGNNIANSKTTGFKSSYTRFTDNFYQGGVGNQIGTGVRVAGVVQDFGSVGSTNTGRSLDMAITSNDFFVLKNASTNARSYSRAGNFFIDNTGYLVNGFNDRVQGYMAPNGIVGAELTDIEVSNAPLAATATTELAYDMNLDASNTPPTNAFQTTDPSSYNFRTDTIIYDSLGTAHTVTAYYIRTAPVANREWNVRIFEGTTALLNSALTNVTFDNAGAWSSQTADLSTVAWTPGGGAAVGTLEFDYSAATQYGIPNETRNITQNGASAAVLTGISVDKSGQISGSYSNGATAVLAQVALANFRNPQGLLSNGNSSWSETSDSGVALIQPSNSAGAFQPGALEDSNVDLTQQLVDLIFAQRIFQANAQTVTAANTLMQTIINIQ